MADWIDLLALGVATTAVGVSVVTLRSDAVGRKAAVRPHISFYRSAHAPTRRVSLKMKSSGLGPAIIAEYSLTFDEKQFLARDDADIAFIGRTLGASIQSPEILSEISPGTALAAGDSLTLVDFGITTGLPSNIDLRGVARRFDARVTFRSVLGDELFTSSSHDAKY